MFYNHMIYIYTTKVTFHTTVQKELIVAGFLSTYILVMVIRMRLPWKPEDGVYRLFALGQCSIGIQSFFLSLL